MKIILVVLFSILFFSCEKNVDVVISQNIEARGGEKNFANLKTAVFMMTLKMMGTEIPLKIFVAQPNMMRIELNVAGQEAVTILNGDSAYTFSDGEYQSLDESAVEELKENYENQLNYFRSDFIKILKQGKPVESFGEEKFNNRDAYKISFKSENGTSTYYFIDKKNYLNLGTRSIRFVDGQKLETESYFLDYRKVGNLLVPFNVEIKSVPDRATLAQMRIDSLSINVDIDKKVFSPN
ncbi:MAG: outer membrane lipoprotein-sorting protein [Ignavibacteria bacterium]|nr:outer membrane lipoprotein-sorting protein [Ignavibacteria bacterium]